LRPTLPAPASSREIQLDVVRGVAILLAMGWHLNAKTGNAFTDFLLLPGHSLGWAGVDLFFVLSGFLVGSLILKEIQRSGRFDAKRFFVRRALRLWPVLYLYLGAQLLFGRLEWETFLPQALLHAQNYWQTPIAQLWSLAVEEHFYLAAGLLVPWAAAKQVKPKTILLCLLALLAVPLILRCAALLSGVDHVSIQWQTHYRIDALACGVMLAVLSVHFPEIFEKLKSRPRALTAIAILGALVLGYFGGNLVFRSSIGYVVAYVASAAFILAIHGRSINPLFQPAARFLAFLGVYSYSIYLWHNGVAREASEWFSGQTGAADPSLLRAFGYSAAIAVSYIITKSIEHPIMRLRDRIYPPAKPKTGAELIADEVGGASRAAA
jgi:peptidoglycan/LPS O-acetylase OafA/YrhL